MTKEEAINYINLCPVIKGNIIVRIEEKYDPRTYEVYKKEYYTLKKDVATNDIYFELVLQEF